MTAYIWITQLPSKKLLMPYENRCTPPSMSGFRVFVTIQFELSHIPNPPFISGQSLADRRMLLSMLS
jgi:hypothetical protein